MINLIIDTDCGRGLEEDSCCGGFEGDYYSVNGVNTSEFVPFDGDVNEAIIFGIDEEMNVDEIIPEFDEPVATFSAKRSRIWTMYKRRFFSC